MPSYKELLRTDGEYFYWPKYSHIKISDHFTTDEFRCKCVFTACNEQKIACSLIEKLELVRAELKAPITVTSGYRCHARQEALRAEGKETSVGKSQHELGRAVDVVASDITTLSVGLSSHFSAVGISKRFIHVDLRDDKERRWTYAN